MKQRVICIVLALLLILSVLAPLAMAAETTTTTSEAAQVLAALDIMVGDGSGDLKLDQNVTRAQFTKMSVASTTAADTIGDTSSVSPFPDVSKDSWYAPWVTVAVEQGLVKGDLAGEFNPGDTITLKEGVTIVLRLLGYQDSAFTGNWPSGQMATYKALGLDAGISIGQDDAMTRQDAMYLFYNMLTTQTATGTGYYLNTVSPGMVTASGEIDMVALINDTMEGPIVADAGWESQVDVDFATATVYRDGSRSSYSAISAFDVVYWSDTLNTLWVYSQKVTGTYQSVSPAASSPTAVVVAGGTYAIETTTAAYALSHLGDYTIGDQITLLLGRDGGVVSVMDADTSGAVLYGMITDTSMAYYTDSTGNSYLSDTVTLLATNGTQYTYAVDDDDWDVGDVVQISYTSDGVAVKKLYSKGISGTVSSDGTTLGKYTLASGVEILDTYKDGGSGLRVYTSRLAGVTISSDDVLFYATNQQGEITHLILDDVTGDMHSYGVLESVVKYSYNMTTSGTYVANVGGMTTVYSTTTLYSVEEGAARIKTDGINLLRADNLTAVTFDTATATQGVTSDNQSYQIWENVTVYERKNGAYYITSLDLVNNGAYTLTGYYDMDEVDGGLVRVIIAK